MPFGKRRRISYWTLAQQREPPKPKRQYVKKTIKNFMVELTYRGKTRRYYYAKWFNMTVRWRDNGKISSRAIVINGKAEGDYLSILCDSPGCGSNVIRGRINSRR